MDYLAFRDHSEKELRSKLARDYSQEDIDAAISYVISHGWLKPPEELAEKVAGQLDRKLKSHLYISQYLRQKGLPDVPKDAENEKEKAGTLLMGKFSPEELGDFESKQRAGRWLASRGFDSSTIRRVLYEEP